MSDMRLLTEDSESMAAEVQVQDSHVLFQRWSYARPPKERGFRAGRLHGLESGRMRRIFNETRFESGVPSNRGLCL